MDSHAALLTARRLPGLMETFDSHIKARFNPYEMGGVDKVPIPFPGQTDIKEIDLRDEYLYFTK